MPRAIEPPSHLPPEPSPHPEWHIYSNAYGIVLGVERRAQERLAINPSGREEKYNLLFTRVTGFLLIELFNERAILSVEPCASLALEIISPPVAGCTTHDLVFGLGRYFYEYFKRTCAFGSSHIVQRLTFLTDRKSAIPDETEDMIDDSEGYAAAGVEVRISHPPCPSLFLMLC